MDTSGDNQAVTILPQSVFIRAIRQINLTLTQKILASTVFNPLVKDALAAMARDLQPQILAPMGLLQKLLCILTFTFAHPLTWCHTLTSAPTCLPLPVYLPNHIQGLVPTYLQPLSAISGESPVFTIHLCLCLCLTSPCLGHFPHLA